MVVQTNFLDLPNEVLLLISNELTFKDLAQVFSLLCKNCHSIAMVRIQRLMSEMDAIKSEYPKELINTFGILHLQQIPTGDFGDYDDLASLEKNITEKQFMMLRGEDHFLSPIKKVFLAARIDCQKKPQETRTFIFIKENTLPPDKIFYDLCKNCNIYGYFKKLNRGIPCGELEIKKKMCFASFIEKSPKVLNHKSVVSLHPLISV
jgi:hypothetical protein